MAKVEVILQGINAEDSHEAAVNSLLTMPKMDAYLLSLAYSRKSGVDAIKGNLRKVADKVQIIVGMRNGVTSVQSILTLLSIGIKPYVVDTASGSVVFHPKIYIAYNKRNAHVIMGSANLTRGGLKRNMEASSFIRLSKKNSSDRKYFQTLIEAFGGLPQRHPDHVFQNTSSRRAVELLHQGRLENEQLARIPAYNPLRSGKNRDSLSPINIEGSGVEKRIVEPQKRILASAAWASMGVLVWESKPLTRRSLNIPDADSTNITGDINLGMGMMEDIDFQRYFREEVFSELQWHLDPNSSGPYLERAILNAQIVIKGLSYGQYELEVTHDPRTDTASYNQRNAMTKVKWGEAREIVAQDDLLERTLHIFKKGRNDFVFIID